jgi:hypothetical protein
VEEDAEGKQGLTRDRMHCDAAEVAIVVIEEKILSRSQLREMW